MTCDIQDRTRQRYSHRSSLHVYRNVLHYVDGRLTPSKTYDSFVRRFTLMNCELAMAVAHQCVNYIWSIILLYIAVLNVDTVIQFIGIIIVAVYISRSCVAGCAPDRLLSVLHDRLSRADRSISAWTHRPTSYLDPDASEHDHWTGRRRSLIDPKLRRPSATWESVAQWRANEARRGAPVARVLRGLSPSDQGVSVCGGAVDVSTARYPASPRVESVAAPCSSQWSMKIGNNLASIYLSYICLYS